MGREVRKVPVPRSWHSTRTDLEWPEGIFWDGRNVLYFLVVIQVYTFVKNLANLKSVHFYVKVIYMPVPLVLVPTEEHTCSQSHGTVPAIGKYQETKQISRAEVSDNSAMKSDINYGSHKSTLQEIHIINYGDFSKETYKRTQERALCTPARGAARPAGNQPNKTMETGEITKDPTKWKVLSWMRPNGNR